MLEKYYKYKLKYNDYLVLIKIGNFYEMFDNDALIMNSIFKYKLKEISNTFKVGFPINSLNKVLKVLDIKNINYVIIDNENVNSVFCSNNAYFDYKFDIKRIYYNKLRVDKICDYLMNNISNSNIIDKIEKNIFN